IGRNLRPAKKHPKTTFFEGIGISRGVFYQTQKLSIWAWRELSHGGGACSLNPIPLMFMTSAWIVPCPKAVMFGTPAKGALIGR
ncbi:MAG: hypothetical protein ACYSTO_07745, partial [Planctomycetota bacterium]